MNVIDLYPVVPAELKALRQWVLWREEIRDKKPTKVPYQINGEKAKSNKPSTWTDYQKACHAYRTQIFQLNGIGFVFMDDPFSGIDIDNCLCENGILKPWAKPIVDRLKTVGYGEVSPFGRGIKFWTRAILPADTKHKVYLTVDGTVCLQGENNAGAIEAYDKKRYFTVTGRGKGSIGDGQLVIDWLYEKYLKPHAKEKHTQEGKRQHSSVLNLPAGEIVKKIRQSKQAHKFETLNKGNTAEYGSQSEADLALCSMIAFWSQDETVIDAIFRKSALMRDKWDEKHRSDGATYGQMTIETAITNRTQTYTPRKRQYTGKARARLATTLNKYFGKQR